MLRLPKIAEIEKQNLKRGGTEEVKKSKINHKRHEGTQSEDRLNFLPISVYPCLIRVEVSCFSVLHTHQKKSACGGGGSGGGAVA